MVTSRTGTTSHLRFRKAVLTRDRKAGITHCPECGVTLNYDISRQPNSAEPDHIIAHRYGGTNDPSNGRTICRQCNQRLGDKRRPQGSTAPLKPSPGW
ncbi:hypothetical protein NS183_07815 [Microbacterium testaceum]|nr:hypothetical protein NS183_07815 [Microbacterium testaceum]